MTKQQWKILNEKSSITTIINNKTNACFDDDPGIYFLLKNDDIVYIGSSKTPITRIYSHKDKDFDSYYIINCNIEELLSLEAEMIFKYTPKYNNLITTKQNENIILVGTIPENINLDNIKMALVGRRIYIKIQKD